MANRVVSFIGIATSTQKGSTFLWTWNNDILLASVMQVAWTGTTPTEDGSKWCGDFKVTLKKDGTAGSAIATNGLNGKSKCTFQFLAEDFSVGPTITISKADYVTALVQWVEWLNSANLDTNAVLPATSAASYHIGNYGTTEGVYFNPLTGQATAETAWKAVAYTFYASETDPSKSWAGSIGKAYYYS